MKEGYRTLCPRPKFRHSEKVFPHPWKVSCVQRSLPWPFALDSLVPAAALRRWCLYVPFWSIFGSTGKCTYPSPCTFYVSLDIVLPCKLALTRTWSVCLCHQKCLVKITIHSLRTFICRICLHNIFSLQLCFSCLVKFSSTAQHHGYLNLLKSGLPGDIAPGQLQGNYLLAGNYIAALRAGTELPGK